MLPSSNSFLTILKSKKPLAKEVEEIYTAAMDSLTQNTSGLELHCFIKKLILSDYITTTLTTEEKNNASGKFDLVEKSGLLIIVEFYLKKEGSYFPMYRFDTTITGDRNIRKDAHQYFLSGISASIRKATVLNHDAIINKNKKLTLEEIQEFNNKQADLPIFKTPVQKGIFLSFDDFKNNKISIDQFIVENDSKGDFLYIKDEKGNETLFTDLWGYFDRNDFFIYSANNFFELYRSGHSFIMYGAKDYIKSRVLRLNFRLIDAINPNSNYSKGHTRAKYDLVKVLMQLDMLTGELY